MKKIITILFLFFIVVGCNPKNKDLSLDKTKENSVISNNGHLYQDNYEIPLLIDNSYFAFYLEQKNEEMSENHSELYCIDYYKVSDMLNHFEYYANDENTFTLKQSIYSLEDGLKYDEMFQTRDYDMNVVKDESYWLDYDEDENIIGCSLNMMEYGNHAPYTLSSFYNLETDTFECYENDLSSEYPDNGLESIKNFLETFVSEKIDTEQLIKDLDTDLYFYYKDTTNDFEQYIGPNSLAMLLTSIDVDEQGRYIKAFLASGNDCKLYIDDDYKIIKIDMYTYKITYEYLTDYVKATYTPKKGETITYKYDYQRNLITN